MTNNLYLIPTVLMDDRKADEAITELSKAIAFKPDLQLLNLRAQFYDSMDDPDQNREQNKFQIKVQTEDSKNYHSYVLRDFEAALCLDPNHLETLGMYDIAKGQAPYPE
ncbi:hypothetical protein GIB67_017107 [Kingdonia uniflora]|uniref:Uncharacterized protein n=1 Tax=Kingdonia uniflora TaxID=39325 RepID=A0A7J7NCX8_9MAGN|nr:hypothetical protein GIB67_017107 [Kingdonia uniflora]